MSVARNETIRKMGEERRNTCDLVVRQRRVAPGLTVTDTGVNVKAGLVSPGLTRG